MMKNEGKTNMDDTALDFLRTRIQFDLDKVYELVCSDKASKSDNVRYYYLSDFLDMIDEAQIDFERSIEVAPDPMLDSQLG
jgi:hypothetical protein